MQPPKISQLFFKDYKGAEAWVIDLLEDLNNVLSDLQALGARNSTLVTLTIQTAPVLADSWPKTISHDLPGSVRGVSVVGLVNVTTGVAPTTAVWPIWTPASTGKGVVIQGITGLSGSTVYRLTLRLES